MSQNQPKRSLRGFSVLRHLNGLLLAGMNNRNVIITQRFHSTPDLGNRDFSGILTVFFNYKYFSMSASH